MLSGLEGGGVGDGLKVDWRGVVWIWPRSKRLLQLEAKRSSLLALVAPLEEVDADEVSDGIGGSGGICSKLENPVFGALEID